MKRRSSLNACTPRDEEAAERHAIDAFLGAINRSLAAEVQKLGCRTMVEVVAATQRIERILGEQPDPKMEQIILSMQDQIRILTKDLKSAHEQMASQAMAAIPTTALAAPSAATVAAAQPPPVAAPPAMASTHPPPAAPLPPLATAQPPTYPPGRQLYPDYGEEDPYFRSPRRQPDRRPQRGFLCDEEGHFAYCSPARSLLQCLLRQQARETAHGPSKGQVLKLPAPDSNQGSPPGAFKLLGGSPKPKVTHCWVRCRATHHRPINSGRHPCPRSRGHRSIGDLPRVFRLVALPRPMGALEAV